MKEFARETVKDGSHGRLRPSEHLERILRSHRLVTAFPTSGKSHFAMLCTQIGIPVMDVDVVTSVVCPMYFKAKLPYVGDSVIDHMIRALVEPGVALATRMWMEANPNGVVTNNLVSGTFLTLLFGVETSQVPLYFYPSTKEALISKLRLRKPDIQDAALEKNVEWWTKVKAACGVRYKECVEIPEDGSISKYLLNGRIDDSSFTKDQLDRMNADLYVSIRKCLGSSLPPRFAERFINADVVMKRINDLRLYKDNFVVKKGGGQ